MDKNKILNFPKRSHFLNYYPAKAFTLAEVLITLGIIGVVAAITMPILINNINNRDKITALKKAYSILAQATLMAIENNEHSEYWEIIDNDNAIIDKLFSYYQPYLKILKYCKNGEKGCWVNEVKDLQGNKFHWYNNTQVGANSVSARLTDGMTIAFDIFQSTKGDLGVNTNKSTLVFFVDVNGEKLPNTFGKDIFTFVLDATNGTIVPAGKDNNSKWCTTSGTVPYSYAGIDCAAKILKENKISY